MNSTCSKCNGDGVIKTTLGYHRSALNTNAPARDVYFDEQLGDFVLTYVCPYCCGWGKDITDDAIMESIADSYS